MFLNVIYISGKLTSFEDKSKIQYLYLVLTFRIPTLSSKDNN